MIGTVSTVAAGHHKASQHDMHRYSQAISCYRNDTAMLRTSGLTRATVEGAAVATAQEDVTHHELGEPHRGMCTSPHKRFQASFSSSSSSTSPHRPPPHRPRGPPIRHTTAAHAPGENSQNESRKACG
jgi:hypothetical protein